MIEIRSLEPGEEAAVEAFLAARPERSLHMLSNIAAVGLAPGAEPYRGYYAGAFERDRLVGVVAHYWNGLLYLRAPVRAASLAVEATKRSGLPIKAIFGPAQQVDEAQDALGVASAEITFRGEPELMTLDLSVLRPPPAALEERLQVRCVRSSEADLVANWFQRFEVDVFGKKESPGLYREALETVQRLRRAKRLWGLLRAGRIVACCGFSARYRDMVQVGPVWVPMGLRNGGYGRAVVAGALLAAREEGVGRAVLLGEDPAARRAYLALGFRSVGRQVLIHLREESFASVALRRVG